RVAQVLHGHQPRIVDEQGVVALDQLERTRHATDVEHATLVVFVVGAERRVSAVRRQTNRGERIALGQIDLREHPWRERLEPEYGTLSEEAIAAERLDVCP